ncbi:MAG: DUF1330 domain-containing protein [Kiloniellaceae bacterium]
MPAYWIGRVNVTDEAAYAEYAKRAGPAIETHGGRFLARGGACVTLEGKDCARNVIVAFASLDQAVACYDSPEYQEAWAFQKGAAERDICIVEGL